MLTTIKGIYSNGIITLIEKAPVIKETEVMVTFLSEEEKPIKKKKIILGMLEGKIKLPDDFNDPLDDLKEYM